MHLARYKSVLALPGMRGFMVVSLIARIPGTAWTTAGGDFSATVGGTVSGLTNDPNRRTFDATSIVQGWLNSEPASSTDSVLDSSTVVEGLAA